MGPVNLMLMIHLICDQNESQDNGRSMGYVEGVGKDIVTKAVHTKGSIIAYNGCFVSFHIGPVK